MVRGRILVLLLVVSISLLVAGCVGPEPTPAPEKTPAVTETPSPSPAKEYRGSVEKGKALFNDPKLGTTGGTCNSCHPNGDTTGGEVMGMKIPSLKEAAATFPKYKDAAGAVITLGMMDNMCIEMFLKGEGLALDSPDAVDLAAYVTYIAAEEGKAVNQTPSDELTASLERGKALYNKPDLGNGTSGLSCNSCHPNGDTTGGEVMGMKIPSLKGAAATFPKYKDAAGAVITLGMMDNMCIEMFLKGEGLALDSQDAVDLAAYVTSFSQGYKLETQE